MERTITHQLLAWKQSKRRKPLVLEGARQVGKTYSVLHFGENEYKNIVNLNFETHPRLCTIFESNLNIDRIIEELQAFAKQEIIKGETLLFLDEIQACPHALTCLKYFKEKANDYHIIAAGSLLGVQLAKSKSFPVGQVNLLKMYPLTFLEFLNAIGEHHLSQLLQNKSDREPLSDLLHSELVQFLKRYYLIGGMPEAVDVYAHHKDFALVREVHHEILATYMKDFSKHAVPSEVMRITAVWDTLPAQLARAHKKFIYSILSSSARAREYESAINWLKTAGLVHKAHQLQSLKLPLNAYIDHQAFKLYMLDVGLLATKSDLNYAMLIEGNRLFTEFKGALTENYVAQQLTATGYDLYYWVSGNKAEVDFIVKHDDQLIPLEVKAEVNTKSKSLSVYKKQCHHSYAVKTSLKNIHQRGNTIEWPLYLIERLVVHDGFGTRTPSSFE